MLLWSSFFLLLGLATANMRPGTKIPDEWIVSIDREATQDDIDAHYDEVLGMEGKIFETFHIGNFRGYAVRLDQSKLKQLKESGPVRNIEQNQIFAGIPVKHPKMEPQVDEGSSAAANHPTTTAGSDVRRLLREEFMAQRGMCASQREAPWGLVRTSQVALTNDGHYTYGADATGNGVRVYIVDTGVRTTHLDFEGRVKWGTDTAEYPSPETDTNGHGSHVAGTILGKNYGVAKDATGFAVRVLGSNGFGTTAGVIEGVEFTVENESKLGSSGAIKAVANMSLGGGASTAMNEAVAAAVEAGIVYVVAAGNESQAACNSSPAAEETAITVACSDSSDVMCYFSNWGRCVDIIAPGFSIESVWNTSDEATNSISGTSMSSPHVAGVVAKLLSINEFKSVEEVKRALLEMSNENKILIESTIVDRLTPNKLVFMDCSLGR